MKKSDIEKELSRKFNLNSLESRKVLDVIIDAMTEMLRDRLEGIVEMGKYLRIEIRHFGSFFTKNYQPYEGRNPRTGEKIKIGEKTLRRLTILSPSSTCFSR